MCKVYSVFTSLSYITFLFSNLAPSQQPPPYHEPLSPSALRIYWNNPDYPNGVIEQYRVFRNGTLIFVLGGTGMYLLMPQAWWPSGFV